MATNRYTAEPCAVGNGDWNIYLQPSKHRILHIYRQPGPDGAQEALALTKMIIAALQAEAEK